MALLTANGIIVNSLARLCKRGSGGLAEFPVFINQAIKDRVWEGWIHPATKEFYSATDFETFVTAPPLKGLGSSVQQVKDLCRHDAEALDLVVEWTTKKPGAPVGNTNASKEEKTNTDNISNCLKRNKQHGTSLDYTLRRLKKEAPELHKKVVAGEVTPNKAAIQAGFRKKTMTVPNDVEGLAKHIKKHFSKDEINQLFQELSRGE